MATNAQVEANRLNAQHSTGPVTDAGKKRSSLNSTVHGFTGQTVFVTPGEKEAYETHCISYIEQYQPKTHQETDLIQQYADQQWSLHQINVQQINLMSLINAATAQFVNEGTDLDTLSTATAKFYRTVNTLGVYEQRRRRAAAETLAQFKELVAAREQALAQAAQTYKALKAQDKRFIPQEFGFVCSLAEIEARIAIETRRAELKAAPMKL